MPGVSGKSAAHHVVVVLPVLVGVGPGVSPGESLAALDEIDKVFLQALLTLEGGLLPLGILRQPAGPEELPGGVEHDDRVKFLELVGLEHRVIFRVNGRISSRLLTEHRQGLRAHRDRAVAETVGLRKNQHLAGLLCLRRSGGGKGRLDLLDDIRLHLRGQLSAVEDHRAENRNRSGDQSEFSQHE